MPNTGAAQYIHWPEKFHAASAGPKDLAGFMEAPEMDAPIIPVATITAAIAITPNDLYPTSSFSERPVNIRMNVNPVPIAKDWSQPVWGRVSPAVPLWPIAYATTRAAA